MKVRQQIKQMAEQNQRQQFESVLQAYKFFLRSFATACEEMVKDQDLTVTDVRRELGEWSEFLKPLVAETADRTAVVQLKGQHQKEFLEKLQNVNQTTGSKGQIGNDGKTPSVATVQASVQGRK